ncbi:MAG: hypothetical protein ABSF20_02695, partial [Smithella sp.]
NKFYSDSFSQLITLTLAIIGIFGIILPLLSQIIQTRMFKSEQKSLLKKLLNETEKIKMDLKKDIENLFENEKNKIDVQLKKDIEIIDKKIKKNTNFLTAGVIYVQGKSDYEKNKFPSAARYFAKAAGLSLLSDDEYNGQRAIKSLNEGCLPNINSEAYKKEIGLDEEIERLLKILKSLNQNGRYADRISEIKIACDTLKK